jgi:uncharacterized damage-inducible protein DinB
MRNENPLVSECVQVLRQGIALLDQLDDKLYAETTSLPVHSGVGGHFRHCLDFYNSFLAGVTTGRVDYNLRARDALVERDRAFASTKLRIAIAELESMPVMDGATPLRVALEGTPAVAAWCTSTVLRELQFLLSHTIHHYALVGLLLRLQGVEPDAEFGVNPSTLQHWQQEEAACVQ